MISLTSVYFNLDVRMVRDTCYASPHHERPTINQLALGFKLVRLQKFIVRSNAYQIAEPVALDKIIDCDKILFVYL